MSTEERRAYVGRRNRSATQAADRARYERDKPKRIAAMRVGDPVKRAARIAVNNAVRDGRLEREPCEACGYPKAEAHHDDYAKPLLVRWLCSVHHGLEHQRVMI